MKQERQDGGAGEKKGAKGDGHRLMTGHIEYGMVFPTQVQSERAHRDRLSKCHHNS